MHFSFFSLEIEYKRPNLGEKWCIFRKQLFSKNSISSFNVRAEMVEIHILQPWVDTKKHNLKFYKILFFGYN